AVMGDLERTGTADDQPGLAPPPPPPPPPGAGGYVGVPASGATARQPLKPVAQPWVPQSLSFLDFNKPWHRVVLMAIFGAFAVAGIGVGIFGVTKHAADSRFNAVAKQAEGVLYGKPERNDIKRRRRARQEAYDITYKFTIDGKQYTGEEDQVRVEDLPGDPSASYDGQNVFVSVFYDPGNPAENRLDEASTLTDKIIIAAGFVCVPVGLFGLWRVFRYDRYARSIGS
ncbi:MAG: hypothetical protein AVDCRST_MAG64-3654, partial [uncultured Phycisphaerae bacterium]